jgi:hypothetical protein
MYEFGVFSAFRASLVTAIVKYHRFQTIRTQVKSDRVMNRLVQLKSERTQLSW